MSVDGMHRRLTELESRVAILWRCVFIVVLSLIASSLISIALAESPDDIRQNKTFISDGICEFENGQKARCTLWSDPNDPGYHYLAIYSRGKLIVIKRMPGMEFEKAENVWTAPEMGI